MCSLAASIPIGVAQGSIPGPLLFISIHERSAGSSTVLSCSGSICADLGRVYKWLQSNQLTLNVLKYKFLE